MPHQLVRMTVNICLFTTLMASNLIPMEVAAACSFSNAPQILFEELGEIPGSTRNLGLLPKREIIGQSNCQLFHSWTPGEVKRNIGPTCPFESLALVSEKSKLFNQVVWSNIGNFARQRKTDLTSVRATTFNWTAQAAIEFQDSFYQSTSDGIETLLRQVRKHPLASSMNPLPGMLRATGESPNESPVFDSGIETPVAKSKIQLSGEQQDPYWQYYADCDRWGVEFTNLLGTAQAINNSVNSLQVETVVETDAIEKAPGNQLYRQQISARLLEWLRIAEFSTVESSGIESSLFPGFQLKLSTDTSRLTAWSSTATDWVNRNLANQIDRFSMGLSHFANQIRPNSEQNYQASRRPMIKGNSTQTQ